MMKNKILSHIEIQHRIKRIAYQIYEAKVNENEIIIAGIEGGGLHLAKKIVTILNDITESEITLCKIMLDKKNPLKSGVTTSLKEEDYKNKSVVVVDDVLKSGTTLIYAVHHFLKTRLKRLKTAVLINRNHKKYPIKADFKGISLSTSLNEHVIVEFKSNNNTVFLE